MPAAPLDATTLNRAPKVLLHDHLDGGLRPETVLELADEHGYRDLPAGDAESLGRWFRQAADSGSLVQYLETFAHTVGVMQRPEAIHRVARECALDLAADEPAGGWELDRVALVLGIWCIAGLVLCIRSFRWQDR